MSEEKERFFWKGKRVTETIFNQRSAQCQSGKKRRKIDHNLTSSTCSCCIEGRRIIYIKYMATNMKCSKCKSLLDLEDIVKEDRKGLGSIFHIPCKICNIICLVPTDKRHGKTVTNENKNRFDVNSKIAIGALHAGMGSTHVNKMLAALNIPSIDFKTFKKYESKIGTAVEEVARESCEKWAEIEKEMTIKNSDNLLKLLPQNIPSNFILPGLETEDSENVAIPSLEANLEDSYTDKNYNENILVQSDCDDSKETYDGAVRVAASYDMGYSTRSNNRTYDSKNGYGAFLGRETGKAIEYFTTNRTCKKCTLGHPKSDHDCRMNFVGSAKAMEPFAAARMVSDSEIFKKINIKVGVLIGDDDSSTIAAVRAVSKSQVIKFSDKNHTSRGLSNSFYKIANSHKELNTSTIRYLQKCFSYALTQNTGNSTEMAAAINNIPHHAFNKHNNCGDWCGFRKNPENYKHRVIGDGFKCQKLYDALNTIFDKFASNVDRFVACASSQANESLNNTMTSHYPKSRCYSVSASGDYRFGCAIGEKNIGEGYIQEALKKRLLSPGVHTSKYVEKREKVAQKRYLNAKRPQFKRRRLFLKENRAHYRNMKEGMDGIQYESNMGLLSTKAINDEDDNIDGINEVINEPDCTILPSQVIVVLFDLETSSFSKTSDILQIAAPFGESSFSAYINPVQTIASQASDAHGLTNNKGELMLHGVRVPSVPLRLALVRFWKFLTKLKNPVILTAHRCRFDAPILINSIKKMSMINDFISVVNGFSDTLSLIQSLTGRKGKGECTLSRLASWLNISTEAAHNAVSDVRMMSQIINNLKITDDQIIQNQILWSDFVKNCENTDKVNNIIKTFSPLNGGLSNGMKKKFVLANITIDNLIKTFKEGRDVEVIKLLGKDENGQVRVSKCKRVLNKLLKYLNENY